MIIVKPGFNNLNRSVREISLLWLLVAAGIICGTGDSAAQDPVLSQYYSNIIYLNPAFAGSSGMMRFSAGYRNHFPSMGSAFVNYHAAFDMPAELLQGGVGFNIMNDVQGDGQLTSLRMEGIYSHGFIINPEIEIIGALQVSYVVRSLKVADLIFPDGIDNLTGIYIGPTEAVSDETSGYPDFAAGILCFSRTWYAGFVAHHLTAPNISFSKNYREPLPRKYTLHAGINIPVFEKRFGREFLQINPNMVLIQQGSQRQINLGAEVMRKGVFAGIWSRQNIRFGMSTVTAVAGFQNDQLRFGYSFDFNVSQPWINDLGAGAHEIGFTYRFNKSGKKTKIGTIKCPKI
jgi:type IX secretion system PorP/SprF family membrane protein